GSFALDDDGNPDNGLTNWADFLNKDAGTYAETVSVPTGWTVSAIQCSDPDGGTTTNAAAGTLSIDLDPTETVSCAVTVTQAISTTRSTSISTRFPTTRSTWRSTSARSSSSRSTTTPTEPTRTAWNTTTWTWGRGRSSLTSPAAGGSRTSSARTPTTARPSTRPTRRRRSTSTRA